MEVIVTCWDPALRCVTIEDMDLVPNLEEYNRILSLSTLVDYVYLPLVRPRYRKRLVELLGLKTVVVDILTQYGSGLWDSIPLDFLIFRFKLVECPISCKGGFVDLREY